MWIFVRPEEITSPLEKGAILRTTKTLTDEAKTRIERQKKAGVIPVRCGKHCLGVGYIVNYSIANNQIEALIKMQKVYIKRLFSSKKSN